MSPEKEKKKKKAFQQGTTIVFNTFFQYILTFSRLLKKKKKFKHKNRKPTKRLKIIVMFHNSMFMYEEYNEFDLFKQSFFCVCLQKVCL